MKENKKTYDQLLLENELFRFILDKIQEGVYVTDQDGIIIGYNKSAQETEGFSPEDILYHSEEEVYGALKDYDFITAFSQPVKRTKIPIKDVYYEYGLGYGKKAALIMSVYPYIVEDEVKAVCTIGRNINQIKDFIIDTLGMRNRQLRDNDPKKATTRYFFEDIVGKSNAMKTTIDRAKLIAKRDSPVLICGETGTGKELMAQSIHSGSLFLDGPFVSVNCAAIPETLLESILFGVSKGSFTGAVEGPGLFEQAEGGSIFLDEINSMPLTLQPKILRVIQEKTVRRVGGKEEIPIDCRFISAVNQDPKEVLEQGRIRSDLFFRLATVELKIPPLRERKDDIDYLLNSFITKYNVRFGLFVEGVTPALFHLLLEYDWPGNIRELENLVESSMNLVPDEEKLLRTQHLSDYFKDKFSLIKPKKTQDPARGQMKEQLLLYEKKLLKECLERNQYNIAKTAEDFDMTRQNLYLRLKKLGIEITNKKYLK